MSWITYIVYGLGVPENGYTPSIEGIKKLLDRAPDSRDSFGFYDKPFGLEDLQNYSEEKICGPNSYFALFCDIVSELENVSFVLADDYDSNCYILLPETYPWRLTPKERDLTEDSVKEILKRYLAEYCEDFDEEKFEKDFTYYGVENGG